jgi:glycerophosphoryl diester phosphodiesterase
VFLILFFKGVVMVIKLAVYFTLVLAVVCGGCVENISNNQDLEQKGEAVSKIAGLIKSFRDASDGNVLVAAHRGDHKHFPENSIDAMLSAVRLGADIVEVDVRMTKDHILVLVHDSTIDRTTNGSGAISKLDYAEIQRFYLKYPDGRLSNLKVPTLQDAMIALKGKCLIMLDKSNNYFDECLEMSRDLDMTNQMLFNNSSKSIDEMKLILEKDSYISYGVYVSALKDKNYVEKYRQSLEQLKLQWLVISYTEETSWLISEEARRLSDKYDVRIWNNSLDTTKCSAGHVDSKALKDPDANWGWQVERGVDIIQTDEIAALKAYLCSIGRHN